MPSEGLSRDAPNESTPRTEAHQEHDTAGLGRARAGRDRLKILCYIGNKSCHMHTLRAVRDHDTYSTKSAKAFSLYNLPGP